MTINRAATFGMIFFLVILGGFVGIKVDQVTLALLGGAFIGVVIASVTTTLIILIAKWKPASQLENKVEVRPTETHYHTNTIYVVVTGETELARVIQAGSRQHRKTPAEFAQLWNNGQVVIEQPKRIGKNN